MRGVPFVVFCFFIFVKIGHIDVELTAWILTWSFLSFFLFFFRFRFFVFASFRCKPGQMLLLVGRKGNAVGQGAFRLAPSPPQPRHITTTLYSACT